MKLILLDIEGTTTSIDFVTEILFPYSISRIPQFVEKYYLDAKYQDLFESLFAKATREFELAKHQASSQKLDRQALIVKFLISLVRRDIKDQDLKTVQGFVWEEGYLRKEIQGHVYPDVPAKLGHWHREGISLGIFSSGSVQAQKLLFKHSMAGDLDRFFKFNFDLSIGSKKSPLSYQKICELTGCLPHDVLFVSDSMDEVKAAAEGGCQVRWMIRNSEAAKEVEYPYPRISSFAEL